MAEPVAEDPEQLRSPALEASVRARARAEEVVARSRDAILTSRTLRARASDRPTPGEPESPER
jgi:hypothetical protein